VSGPTARRLVLILLLAAGAWLLLGARAERAASAAAPRWPADDAVYAVDGWAVGPAAVQEAWGVAHVTRELRSVNGTVATVLLSTNTTGKGVIGTAEVPFLGTGYAVTPAPTALLPGAPQGRTTVVLARGPEAIWLLCYAYGGRAGPVPDAARGWGLVLLDAALGRPNDYFLLRVMTRGPDPAAPPTAAAAQETARLAEALVTRLAAWYAR
jgi:hypothetical protein